MTHQKPVGPPPTSDGPAPSLTEGEVDVLCRFAAGETYRQIAAARGITEGGVAPTASRIIRKLGAKNMVSAVHLAQLAGLLDAPRPQKAEVVMDGTMRLLHSLIAAGWTLSAIAGRMGIQNCELSSLMRRSRCTPLMAGRVERVFLHLYGLDPLEQGVHPQGVTRSLNLARSRGWEVVPAAEVDAMRQAFTHAA